MSTINTVTQYFTEVLRQMGYDFYEPSVYWSLGYCQGDGMDFAGTVDREGVIRLYSRLIFPVSKDRNKRLWRALKDGAVSVEVKRIQSHYHHYNTMQTEVEWDEDSLRHDYGFTAVQIRRLEDFRNAVDEDVRDVSKSLQADGYKLLEACNPFWFNMPSQWQDGHIGDLGAKSRTYRRGDMTVQISMVQDDGYEGYSDDLDHSEVKRLIAGEVVSYSVRVLITKEVKGGPEVVFDEWVSSISDYRSEIRPLAIARELLKEANARQAIGIFN